MLFKYDIFIELGGYKGIINVFTSISFFIGFYLLPLNNIPTFFKNLIKTLTSYTNGIYCVHSRFINLVRVCFGLEGTFKSCIIIYLLSYFLSFFGIKIFGKTKLKYLFI